MATKELSIREKLENLYTLQVIDSKLSEIEVLKGELPMEVKDLEDEVVGLETRISNLESGLADIDMEVSNHHANIAEAEALIERYNSQLDNVKNNREYDALTKEIELQKLEIMLSNKKIKDTAGAKESKGEQLTTAKERKEKKVVDLEQKKEELAKIIVKTEKEEAKLMKKTVKARKSIEERLLNSYDKIRTTYRNGLAVVPVSRGSCGGCFNKIPPQQIIEIGAMKNVIACEHCGRVLVGGELVED